MIEGNVIKFGYGDIAVGATKFFTSITFRNFKPPHECGTNLMDYDDIEYIGEQIIITFYNEKECIEFKDLLGKVENKEIETFEFKSYIFDFSNYNEESIKVCQGKLKYVYDSLIMFSAC